MKKFALIAIVGLVSSAASIYAADDVKVNADAKARMEKASSTDAADACNGGVASSGQAGQVQQSSTKVDTKDFR